MDKKIQMFDSEKLEFDLVQMIFFIYWIYNFSVESSQTDWLTDWVKLVLASQLKSDRIKLTGIYFSKMIQTTISDPISGELKDNFALQTIIVTENYLTLDWLDNDTSY